MIWRPTLQSSSDPEYSALSLNRSSFLANPRRLIASSRKTSAEWNRSGSVFPVRCCALPLSTQELTSIEKKAIGRLARKGRRSLRTGQQMNPVLVLTKTELLGQGDPRTLRKDCPALQGTAQNMFFRGDLQEICDFTLQVHLGMESIHEWWKQKAEHKRRKAANCKPGLPSRATRKHHADPRFSDSPTSEAEGKLDVVGDFALVPHPPDQVAGQVLGSHFWTWSVGLQALDNDHRYHAREWVPDDRFRRKLAVTAVVQRLSALIHQRLVTSSQSKLVQVPNQDRRVNAGEGKRLSTRPRGERFPCEQAAFWMDQG